MESEIIRKITADRFYRQCARNITREGEMWQDLYQECMLILCEQPERLEHIPAEGLKYYITRVMLNQWKNPRSTFWRKYGKADDLKNTLKEIMPDNYNNEIDRAASDIKAALNKLGERSREDWFDAHVFNEIYVECRYTSIRELARATNINRDTLANSVKKTKKYLKATVRNYDI